MIHSHDFSELWLSILLFIFTGKKATFLPFLTGQGKTGMIALCVTITDPRTRTQSLEGWVGCAGLVTPWARTWDGDGAVRTRWVRSRVGFLIFWPAAERSAGLSEEGAPPALFPSEAGTGAKLTGLGPQDPFPLCYPPAPCTLHQLPSLSAPASSSPSISAPTMTSPPHHLHAHPPSSFISGYQGRLDFFNYRSLWQWCLQGWPSSRAGSDVPMCSLSAWLPLFIPRSLASLRCRRSEALTWSRRLEVTAVKGSASEIIAAVSGCWRGWERSEGRGRALPLCQLKGPCQSASGSLLEKGNFAKPHENWLN